MIAIDPASARQFSINVQGYAKRVEAGMARLAKRCGYDVRRAITYLRSAYTCFDQSPSAVDEGGEQSQIDGAASCLPLMFELMVQLSDGQATAFGFRTPGRVQSRVSSMLQHMLSGTLQFLLQSGLTPAEIGLLPRAFRHAFPRLQELDRGSRLVAPMLLAVVPREASVRAQVFFNTRFGNPFGHEENLNAMLALADFGWSDFTHHLYDTVYVEPTRFYAAGYDLDSGVSSRALVYLLFDREHLSDFGLRLRDLATRAPLEMSFDPTHALESLDVMLQHFEANSLAAQIELGMTLQRNRPVRLKFSVMFEKRCSLARLKALLRAHGAPTNALDDAIRAISGRVTTPLVSKHPIHALALQCAPHRKARFDLVLEPLL